MNLWRLLVVLWALAGFCLLGGCGSNNQDLPPSNVAFTPRPRPTPVPKLCGNGIVDDVVGEECDPTAPPTCGGSESCVCCLCLEDDEELGERVFTVARPPSRFQSTGLAGGDVSIGLWIEGPIVLRAGRPDPNILGEAACSAELELAEDAVIGWNVLDQSTVCTKIFAEGSAGLIDCDGVTAHDVVLTQNSNGTGEEDEAELEIGLGDPLQAGPGAASFTVPRLVTINVPLARNDPVLDATICPTLDYDDPLNPAQVARLNIVARDVLVTPVAFTTRRSTGTVTDVTQGGPDVSLSAEGVNFTCGSWSETDAVGTIVGAISGLDTVIGDTVNMYVLSDAVQP